MNPTFFFAFHLILLHIDDTKSLRVIKPNVIALEVSGDPMTQKTDVSLRCGENLEGSEIRWRKNGHNIPVKGNNIDITIHAMLGGNFTCHGPSGDILNHTLVLVKPVDFEKVILTETDQEFITCVARNYNGPFHCSWKWDSVRHGVVVYFSAFRNSQLINCSLDPDNSGLTCEELHCPYSEEVSRINLTLLVRNQYRLEEHHKTFFTYEISKSFKCHLLDSTTHITHISVAICTGAKPERVNIVKAEDDEFEWETPKTWNTPCSFFPLQYEVKVVSHRKDCEHNGNHSEPQYTNKTHYMVTSKKSYTFCVRAQDLITNQIWSEWSQKRVTKQKSEQ